MELEEILVDDQVLDEEIRLWHTKGSRIVFTHHYLARENGTEVGFLSVDIEPEAEYFVLYKLFVPTHLRKQGIATRILKASEELGRRLGYRKVLLHART